jgi:hypothetical protein
MDIVASFCYKFYYICFIYIHGQLVSGKTFTHTRDISELLLEIMKLVSSVNIMGIAMVLIAKGRSFM